MDSGTFQPDDNTQYLLGYDSTDNPEAVYAIITHQGFNGNSEVDYSGRLSPTDFEGLIQRLKPYFEARIFNKLAKKSKALGNGSGSGFTQFNTFEPRGQNLKFNLFHTTPEIPVPLEGKSTSRYTPSPEAFNHLSNPSLLDLWRSVHPTINTFRPISRPTILGQSEKDEPGV